MIQTSINKNTGVFITLEGGEGTGKTTQIQKMYQALTQRGIDVVMTREPGGTKEAEKIRDLLVQRDGGDWDPISEALLLSAARREHLQKKILPALEAGKWVVSDRFVDSTRVFQGYGMGLDQSLIENLYHLIAGDFKPDLTFVLDIPTEKGLARSNKQLQMTELVSESTEDRYELMGLAFHEKLRAGFLEVAEKHSDRCVVIDALLEIETIHKQMLDILEERFFLNNHRDQKEMINE